MPLTVNCISDTTDLDCCSGQVAATNFQGLLLSDTGLEKRIYFPYDYYATANGVLVADHRGNSHVIPVSGTDFSSVSEIQDFLSGCRSKRTRHALIENFTGNRYTPPWTLATSEVARRVRVFLSGVKQAYGPRWYADNGDIVFYIGAESEDLEIFQD